MIKDNQDNKNKTVLITGATSGIGYELSRLFAQNGFNLVLVARNKQRLEQRASELKSEFGIVTTPISRDLSVPTSPEEIFAELQRRSIHINILVNNAGFNVWGPFFETDLSEELRMIHTNLVSLTHLTKLFIREMLKRGSGKILNVGSTGSFVPGPLNAVYCATKGYILSFSEAIAAELKGTGVSVTTLCPGATRTEFAARAQMKDVRLFHFGTMDAETVAKIGYRGLMKGKRTVIAGLFNKLQILSIRFTPRGLSSILVKYLMEKR